MVIQITYGEIQFGKKIFITIIMFMLLEFTLDISIFILDI